MQMPRYYFHIRSPDGDQFDEIGEVHPNRAAAEQQARLAASDMLRDAALTNDGREETLELTDEDGRLVFSFRCAGEKGAP
jgi:hypothetical protein